VSVLPERMIRGSKWNNHVHALSRSEPAGPILSLPASAPVASGSRFLPVSCCLIFFFALESDFRISMSVSSQGRWWYDSSGRTRGFDPAWVQRAFPQALKRILLGLLHRKHLDFQSSPPPILFRAGTGRNQSQYLLFSTSSPPYWPRTSCQRLLADGSRRAWLEDQVVGAGLDAFNPLDLGFGCAAWMHLPRRYRSRLAQAASGPIHFWKRWYSSGYLCCPDRVQIIRENIESFRTEDAEHVPRWTSGSREH